MPATEKTWRDQMGMHVIFGISALVMLVATIWMLAKDHSREWRATELANRNKDAWTATAMLHQESAVSQSELEKLASELQVAEAGHIDPAFVEKFKVLVVAEDERLAKAGVKEEPANFADLDAATAELAAAPEGSPEAKAAREELKDKMDKIVREARRREDSLTRHRKFQAAKLTAITSMRGIAVGEGKVDEVAKLQGQITTLGEEIADLDVSVTAAKVYRQSLEAIVKEVTSQEDGLAKQVDGIQTGIKRLEENVARQSGGVGDWVNRWPVLDALYTGNIKLEQIWLPEIKINYNFSSVSRYDRCINCHRSIDATAPGSATEPAYPGHPARPAGARNRTHHTRIAANCSSACGGCSS